LLLPSLQVAERLPDVLTRRKIEAALRLLARDVQGHRAELTRRGAPAPGLERYAVNVLARRPLVAVPGGYVAPSLWLLVQRFTSGVFFDFLEPREGSRKQIQAFTSLFGRAFERYVGEELAAHFGPGELWPEPEYSGHKGPDWTIVEGRQATVIECKTSRLTLEEREAARVGDIRARLRKEIVDALKKLPGKLEQLQRRKDPALKDWPEIDDVECVIVTLEPWWPDRVTRELIAEELRGHPAASLKYHLMWVEQLEQLGSFRAKARIFDRSGVSRRSWTFV